MARLATLDPWWSSMRLSESAGVGSLGPRALAIGKSENPGGCLIGRNRGAILERRALRATCFKSRRLEAFSGDFWHHDRARCVVVHQLGNCKGKGELCSHCHACRKRRKWRVLNALSTLPATQLFADSKENSDKWRLEDDILELKSLQRQMKGCENLEDKIEVLKSSRRVRAVFGGVGQHGIYVMPSVELACRVLDENDIYMLMCLVASGQEHVLEWPIGIRDPHDGQEKPPIKVATGNPVSSFQEIFKRFGKIIESWEGSPETFWENLPAILTSRSGEIHSNNSAERLNSVNHGVRYEETEEHLLEMLRALVHVVAGLEKIYDSIGGIIGYQLRALELIKESENEKNMVDIQSNGGIFSSWSPQIHFSVPGGPDLATDKAYATQAASWGLEGLPVMGEIYPLGGSGDRLGLVDELSGECLPVAMLPYSGRTLLEGHIRDLQAREYFYFKVFGTQQITPVAIMTSTAKKNDERVYALCESLSWFGRGRENFRLFKQPLVPTVAVANGKWLVCQPLQLVVKPGGHGVIWKLANDEGVFKWFYNKGRKAAIVRQISNPVAGTDCTLLALSGIGLKHNKKLGFASCERNVGAAEGVNVLMEKNTADGSREYAITCIEYTEFNKLGILDVPVTQGSMQAQYPANTNVLYVDLPSVENVASSQTAASLPGMIMNLKKTVDYVDHHGNKHSVRAGRLECTMQNVADSFLTKGFSRLSSVELDTYLIYNERRKVSSSAKRRMKPDDYSLHQTPEGSFLDITRNASDLLKHCGVDVPLMEGNHCYIDFGPPFLVFMHPSLGPLWDVIYQKIQGGSLGLGSELQLEVAELAWKNVQIDGSLLIKATNIMGSMEVCDNGEPILQYGVRCGRCKLSNVQVKNKGIDWRCPSNVFWKNKVQRLGALEIILEEDAEFEASSVTIEGSHKFFVPKGHKMTVTSTLTGEMICGLETLATSTSRGHASWNWHYELQEKGTLELKMVCL